MARYRQFYCAFWDDPDVENYTPNQKLIHAYFFTNNNTTESGIYPVTVKKISNGTGIKAPAIEIVLRKKQLKNIYYDWDKKVVFVAKFLKHNCRGNPELIKKSIIKDMQTIHTILWHQFQKEYSHYFNEIMRENKVLYKSYVSLFQTIIEDEDEVEADNRKDKEGKSTRFKKPTIEDIRTYCIERKNSVDPDKFYYFYESKGWMVGKNKMRDWKAAIITWEKNSNTATPEPPKSQITVEVAREIISRDGTTNVMVDIIERLPDDELALFIKTVVNKDKYVRGLYQRAKQIIEKRGKK